MVKMFENLVNSLAVHCVMYDLGINKIMKRTKTVSYIRIDYDGLRWWTDEKK